MFERKEYTHLLNWGLIVDGRLNALVLLKVFDCNAFSKLFVIVHIVAHVICGVSYRWSQSGNIIIITGLVESWWEFRSCHHTTRFMKTTRIRSLVVIVDVNVIVVVHHVGHCSRVWHILIELLTCRSRWVFRYSITFGIESWNRCLLTWWWIDRIFGWKTTNWWLRKWRHRQWRNLKQKFVLAQSNLKQSITLTWWFVKGQHSYHTDQHRHRIHRRGKWLFEQRTHRSVKTS